MTPSHSKEAIEAAEKFENSFKAGETITSFQFFEAGATFGHQEMLDRVLTLLSSDEAGSLEEGEYLGPGAWAHWIENWVNREEK